MAPVRNKAHLRLVGNTDGFNYRYPRRVTINNEPKAQDRIAHGTALLQQLNSIQQTLNESRGAHIPQGMVQDDVTYVVFTSEWGYHLKLESLDQDKQNPNYQILNIIEEARRIDGAPDQTRDKVTLMLKHGALSQFIQKVEQYLTQNGRHKGEDTGKPKHQALINNISAIKLATLESFWTDAPEIPFPVPQDVVWWEVWFRRTQNDDSQIEKVLQNLRSINVQIGLTELTFAEHKVRLVRGSSTQLSQSLLLLDNLAEIRKPQEIADFFSHKHESIIEHEQWLDDLRGRLDVNIADNGVLVCLLDSGVNNRHPLLTPFLPDEQLYTYKDAWGTYDGWPNGGHGTGVAGLALYGDFTDAFATPSRIAIHHGLESFKIYQGGDPTEVDLYGAVTEFACSAPYVDRPDSPRVFCMTITDKGLAFKGRPSAWSAAVDKIAFGSYLEPAAPQLIIVSGGNVQINLHSEHPDKNQLESIHDPGQAYNCLTVGAYTRKDRVDQNEWPGWSALAQNGAMSPSNSTSMLWERQWPIKPDIVMEGGNLSTDGTHTSDHPSLKIFTADADYPRALFLPFGDTSGAAALAAKMAAELRTSYPDYWPETIRALMVHSADWTPAMLNGQRFEHLSERERFNLVRSVGYGVPIFEQARYSAQNSLTLIAERSIQPYKLTGSVSSYNEFHLFTLPWPIEFLQDALYDQDVTLKVTLSYFIEPNPGSRAKKYANNFQYHSHNLDFVVIKRDETLEHFKRRVSAASETSEDALDSRDEPWLVKRVRSRGSIKKDFITMSGADMATRNKIAIFPKNGWYRNRKKLGKVETQVRYSLIITIEATEVNADIYTPVQTIIENLITST